MEQTENKNSLSRILKGAPEKGVTLYSPWFGDMKVKSVDPDNIKCYLVDDSQHRTVIFDDAGYVKQVFAGYSDMIQKSAECMLFPSREVRTWDNFSIDVYPDLPGTWEDFRQKFSEELKSGDGTIPYSESMKSLQKLMILRDCYRKSSTRKTMKFNVGADFTDAKKFKTYPVINNRISLISFQDEMLAEKFINNFSDLLKDVREFI